MDDITIDRLVLDIPGLTVEGAKEVAAQVGQGLAHAAVKEPEAKESNFPALTIDLNDQAASRNLPRLADMIVESILRKIG